MAEFPADLIAGISAAQAGDKEQSRTLLLRVLEANPHNELALLWLSSVMPTTEHALLCIEQLLGVNPEHAQALEAREVLRIRLMLEEAAVFQPVNQAPSTAQRRYLLGEALIEARIITQHQLDTALAEQARLARKRKPQRLGEILIRLKLVRKEQLEAALAAQIETMGGTAQEAHPRRLGDFLARRGLITRAQLHQGLAEQTQERRRGKAPLLGDVLVRCGYLQRDQLNRALLEWQNEYDGWYR